jgi:hypothetical protein
MDKYRSFERVSEVNELTGGFFPSFTALSTVSRYVIMNFEEGVNILDLSSNISRVFLLTTWATL